jgi:hypothetical protein
LDEIRSKLVLKRNQEVLTQEEADELYKNMDNLYQVEQENISLKNFKFKCRNLEIQIQSSVSIF